MGQLQPSTMSTLSTQVLSNLSQTASRPVVFTARPRTPLRTTHITAGINPMAHIPNFHDEENPFLDKGANSFVEESPFVGRSYDDTTTSALPPRQAGVTFSETIGLRLDSYRNYGEFHRAAVEASNKYQDAYLACKSLLDDETHTRYVKVIERPLHASSTRFMSFASLADSDKEATAQDDLEAFFWVFLFCVLRYTSHNAARAPGAIGPAAVRGPNLQALLSQIFYRNAVIEEEYGPGFPKMLLLLTGRPLPLNFEVADNLPLTAITHAILEVFQHRTNFLVRTIPKRIRSLGRKLNVNYNLAEAHYLASEEYEFEFFKHDILYRDLIAILRKSLADEIWPVGDKSVDGLANTMVTRSVSAHSTE